MSAVSPGRDTAARDVPFVAAVPAFLGILNRLLTLSEVHFATGSHDGSEVNASQLDRGQVAGDLLPEKPMVGGPGLSNAPQL